MTAKFSLEQILHAYVTAFFMEKYKILCDFFFFKKKKNLWMLMKDDWMK